MPILEKMYISLYLGIFQMTAAAAAAATVAAATSQELSKSGKAPGPSRTGSKYPVQESLTSIYGPYGPYMSIATFFQNIIWGPRGDRSEGFYIKISIFY